MQGPVTIRGAECWQWMVSELLRRESRVLRGGETAAGLGGVRLGNDTRRDVAGKG